MPAIRSWWPYWTCWAYAVSPIRGLRIAVPSSLVVRSLDQSAEQPDVPGYLGMPLHTKDEPAARVLDRLGQAILRPSGDGERARIGDALVVIAVDLHIVAHQRRDPAAFGEACGLAAVDARRGPVLLVAEHIGQVLVQPATRGHNQQLHAPAHAEHRHVIGQRGAGEQH